jgi:lipoprotein NlpI
MTLVRSQGFIPIEADPAIKGELLLVASELLEKVTQKAGFSSELLASIYIRRGVAYFLNKEYRLAIEDFERAITLVPKFIWAYGLRGIAYYLLNEYQLAIVDFDRALELDPNYVWAYAGRGFAYGYFKNFEQAMEDFDSAFALDPNFALAYTNLGITRLWMQDISLAQANFTQAWQLDATDILAKWMSEWCTMCEKKADSGMANRLETIAAIDPQQCIAFVCQGVAVWLLEYSMKAMAMLDQAIHLDPDTWDAYFWKAIVLASLQ